MDTITPHEHNKNLDNEHALDNATKLKKHDLDQDQEDLHKVPKLQNDTLKKELKNINTSRCNMLDCMKKLGLVTITCRCEKTFCNKHRLPENHSCSFDYKTTGRTELAKQNQSVTYEKIIKI